MPTFRPSTALAALLLALPTVASGGSPFTATDLMALQRLSDPQVAPDGARVAFTLTEVDLAANSKSSDLWIVPVAGGSTAPKYHDWGDWRSLPVLLALG